MFPLPHTASARCGAQQPGGAESRLVSCKRSLRLDSESHTANALRLLDLIRPEHHLDDSRPTLDLIIRIRNILYGTFVLGYMNCDFSATQSVVDSHDQHPSRCPPKRTIPRSAAESPVADETRHIIQDVLEIWRLRQYLYN